MIRNALCRTLWTVALLAVNLFCLSSIDAQQVSPAPRLITAAVNNSDRVSLGGRIRESLKQARDLGVADPSLMAKHVVILLNRTAERQAALEQYLSDIQNTQSAQYHQWLTPGEYGARFGASPDDVQTLVTWLQSRGLTIERASAAANTISFSGTIGQVQNALSTTIHSVSVNGEKHLANLSMPQLPRALVPAVKGITGLDDFHPRSNVHLGPGGKFNTNTHRFVPNLTGTDQSGNPILYAVPADIATIYDLPNPNLNKSYKGTNYDGTGVTVGIVGDSNVDMVPVTNYREAFLGETASTLNLPTVIVDGDDPGINGNEVETFLDMEVLGGMAPKAKINYYTSADSDLSGGLLNAIERAINDNEISILNVSFGDCEANLTTAGNQLINELYEQAAAQGITIAVSSGDAGATECDVAGVSDATEGLAVNGLGSTPYNVSVGGTDYDVLLNSFSTYVNATSLGEPPYYGTALSYIPEEPWNNSTFPNGALANNSPSGVGAVGGGGGLSIFYAKPAFQASLTPADGARDVPDVSFLAGDGFYGANWALCETKGFLPPDCATVNGALGDTSTITGVGGTSAATPAFAGMLALVVQSTGSRLGQANNVLYKLAANKYSTVFHDVTTGNNSMPCSTGSPDCGADGFTTGYDASSGYDLASGLGSVDAAAMLVNWSTAVGTSSSASLTINGSTLPVSVTHGTSLNFAVDVNPSTASGVAGLVNTARAAAGSPTLNGAPAFAININNGTGMATYNGLPGGQYTVYANYGGDLNDAASQSNAISVNIAPESSSTLLSVNVTTVANGATSNLNAIPYGSEIVGEASVYGTAEGYANTLGYATGSVTYLDNGKSIGSEPITSGNFASFPTLSSTAYPYPVGAHKLTAAYPGDASFKADTSNEVDFTIVQGISTAAVTPSTATVSSTGVDNVQVAINTSILVGNPPTGTVTLSANGKTLGAGELAANAFATIPVNIPVNGSQLVGGQNTITATYSGDTNYTGSTGIATITATLSSFQLTASAIKTVAGSATSNTATISVVPSGNFAGLVDVSCAVTTAPANATSPITCAVPSSILLTGTGVATGMLTINSTTNTSGGVYVVTITGKDDATGTVTARATSTVTITAAPGITLSNSAPITITAGATSGNTSTLSVTPINGFTGVVNLSCSITPAPANGINPIICEVSPSITISGTTASTSVLTIASNAPATGALRPDNDLMRGLGGTVLALGLFFCVPTRLRRQLPLLATLVAIASLGSLVGCGSGGSTANSGSGGGTTPPTQTSSTAATYVVTITADPAGAATQTTTVNVTVK